GSCRRAAPPSTRPCTGAVAWGDRESAGLLAKSAFRNVARVLASGRKRFQRYAHGREYFQGRRRNFRGICPARGISRQDSIDWTSPGGTDDNLQNSARI